MRTVATLVRVTGEPLGAHDPAEIGPYRLLRRLGEGGMGVVYLAADQTGHRVAVKVIRPLLAGQDEFRARFRSEVALARKVARFSTAPIIDADTEADQPYVVTEFIDGPTLSAAVREHGPLPGSQLHALGIGVAGALTAIHRAGVVHRDLKPSNVLLSRFGPRVIDFGIARATDDLTSITVTGQLIGSPAYMAPEQLRGEPVTTATDLFAWGAVMAFAGTGRQPFGTSTDAIAYRVLHGEADLDGLDRALLDPVRAALSKDPSQRPTAQRLLDALLANERGESAPRLRRRRPWAVAAGGRRRPWPVAVAAAGAVVVGLGVTAFVLNEPERDPVVPDPAAVAVAPIAFDDTATGPAKPVPGAKRGGTITGLRATRWDHLDPQRAHERDAMSVGSALLYRTLTGYVDDGKGRLRLVGDLATDTGRSPDGGKTWTYTLRPGLRYQDGTPITAADVAYGIARAFAPEVGGGPTELTEWLGIWHGPYATGQRVPPGVTVNGGTIEFRFGEPHPELPMVAALGTTAPVPPAADRRDGTVMSSGPYRVETSTPQRLVLRRNAEWNPDTDPIRTAYPDRWVFEFGVADATARLRAPGPASDTAFSWTNVPSELVDTLPPEARERTLDGVTQFNRFLAINTERVTDLSVRQAIVSAIDREKALKAHGAAGRTTGSMISATVPGHRDGDTVGGDRTHALALLAGRRPTLTYAHGTGADDVRLAGYVVSALKAVGFKVTPVPIPGDQRAYYRTLGTRGHRYDLYLVAWGPDIPDASGIFPQLFSGASIERGTNYSFFSDPLVNARIRTLQNEPDRAVAAHGYAELDQRLLRDHVPAVPLYDARQYSLHGARLGGLSVHRVHGTVGLERAHVR